jgi:hypothetical protein
MLASTPPSLSERVGGPRKWTARASSPLAATSYPSGCTEDAALDPHPVNQRQGIPSRLPGALFSVFSNPSERPTTFAGSAFSRAARRWAAHGTPDGRRFAQYGSDFVDYLDMPFASA